MQRSIALQGNSHISGWRSGASVATRRLIEAPMIPGIDWRIVVGLMLCRCAMATPFGPMMPISPEQRGPARRPRPDRQDVIVAEIRLCGFLQQRAGHPGAARAKGTGTVDTGLDVLCRASTFLAGTDNQVGRFWPL